MYHLTSHSGGSHPLSIGCVTNPKIPLFMAINTQLHILSGRIRFDYLVAFC